MLIPCTAIQSDPIFLPQSRKMSSVENLDQANDVAETKSSTVSLIDSHLDSAFKNEQAV